MGGITGSGKTAIGTLAYSLFYSTKVEIPRFNGTRNGFEKIFAGLLDLPIFIDDANNLADNERKQAERMIYDFVNGVGRIRTNKNLDTLRPSTFYGSLLTSGEHFLTTSNSAGGAKTREMEFNIGKSFIPKETAVKIYKITKKNYGLFLKEWIETIQEREEEIKEVYEIIRYGGTLQKIKIEGFHNTYEGKIPRHIDNIAAITTANIYFTMRFLKEDDNYHSEIRKLSAKLGITKVDRLKLVAPAVEKKQNKFEKFLI